MKRWILTAKITGGASAVVDAETEDEARAKAFDADWEIDDWDLSTESHNGGYLDVMEDKR